MRGLSIVSKQVHCWQVGTCILCMAAEMVVLFCKDTGNLEIQELQVV